MVAREEFDSNTIICDSNSKPQTGTTVLAPITCTYQPPNSTIWRRRGHETAHTKGVLDYMHRPVRT